jgi:hypothetical protein
MAQKETFTLTLADVNLLDTMQGVCGGLQWLFPDAEAVGRSRMMAVWAVLGEKHGFDPETIEKHPDGEPKVLAEKTS